MEHIILDTDVAMSVPGEDIDDGFALGLAVADPLLDLRMVTTVDGNTGVGDSTRIAKQLLARLHADIPVVQGADRPLSGRRRKCWGTPSEGISSVDEIPAAMRIINELRAAEPGFYTLVAIGPLTNIALAMLLDAQAVHRAKRLVIMGGHFFGTQRNPQVPGEYNIWADPEAADIVFSSGLETWCVGLDVTHKVTMNLVESQQLAQSGCEYGAFAGRCALGWIDNLNTRSEKPVESFFLHDPLAVAAVAHPELITWSKHDIVVVTEGQGRGITLVGPENGSHYLAASVDVLGFKRYLLDALATL